MDDGNFNYNAGSFLSFIESCDVKKNNIFVIDEINRADIGSVFGELLFLLDNDELDRKVELPLSKKTISLPKNLIIIGTMNTADKSIALIDYALRRRFNFVHVSPDYESLQTWLNTIGSKYDIEKYIFALRVLNHRILTHPLMGKNMLLGQSFFVPKMLSKSIIDIDSITSQFNQVIIPQIESYLGLGNYEDLSYLLTPEINDLLKQGLTPKSNHIENLLEVLSQSKELELDEKT